MRVDKMSLISLDTETTTGFYENFEALQSPEETLSFLEGMWNNLFEWAMGFLPKLVFAIIILLLGWWLSKVISKSIRRMMDRRTVETAVVSFTYTAMLSGLRIVTILLTIAALGADISGIIAAIAAAGVTVGLALKDSLSNFASGILIVLNRTFRIGDYLEIAGVAGVVEKIEFMNTYLKTGDGKEIIIPNSKLTANNIVNYSKSNIRMIMLNCRIGYENDIKHAKELLVEIIDNNELVLHDPEYTIEISSHNDESIGIDIKVWCKLENEASVQRELTEDVKSAFEKEGILTPMI